MKTHLAFVGRCGDRLRPPPPDIARALARVRNTSGVLAVAFGPHVAGAPHRRAVLRRTLALAELAAGPINAHVDDAVVYTSEKRKCALAVAAGHATSKSARRLLRQLEQEHPAPRNRPRAQPRAAAQARETAQAAKIARQTVQAQAREARAARREARIAAQSQARAARAARVAAPKLPRSSSPPSAGSHLLALLQSKGLSAKAVAQLIGVCPVSVYYWCRGHHAPRAGKLARLADALQVEPATLREVLSLDAARAAP